MVDQSCMATLCTHPIIDSRYHWSIERRKEWRGSTGATCRCVGAWLDSNAASAGLTRRLLLVKVVAEVLGTGSDGTEPSLALSVRRHGEFSADVSVVARLLFNCGEGSQRLCGESGVKLRSLDSLFLTRLDPLVRARPQRHRDGDEKLLTQSGAVARTVGERRAGHHFLAGVAWRSETATAWADGAVSVPGGHPELCAPQVPADRVCACQR